MSCLSSTRVAQIKAQIAVIDAQIAAFEAAYLIAAGNSEIQAFRFDSGVGSQRADRRAPKEIRVEISALQADRDRLQRKLDGTSNVNMKLRRRRGVNGHGY